MVAVLARFAVLLGVFLVTLAVPISIGSAVVVVGGAPTLAAGLDIAFGVIEGPLGTPGGVEWLFHPGVLGVLAGAWLSGVGLVVSELLD